MAIDSDVKDADSNLAVRFYKKAVKLDDESISAGRPIFKDYDFVNIIVPGNGLTEIDTYAREEHKRRFPRQWAHYMNTQGTEAKEEGTPIEEWPLVTRAQAEELRGRKFRTVESIAHASDQNIQSIGMIAGMSPHTFRDKALAFLNLASESAETEKKNAELQALKEENAKIKAETDARIAEMQTKFESQMATLLAAVAEKTPKTRKSKAVEA